MLNSEEIEKRFGKHKAAIEGPNPNEDDHDAVRRQYKLLAGWLDVVLPEGRNKSLALTALEEASVWSHKAIANDRS